MVTAIETDAARMIATLGMAMQTLSGLGPTGAGIALPGQGIGGGNVYNINANTNVTASSPASALAGTTSAVTTAVVTGLSG
ncbi:hypothetical protein HC928_03805 [bacterium]|nr:hypothetical protein [bacterium]